MKVIGWIETICCPTRNVERNFKTLKSAERFIDKILNDCDTTSMELIIYDDNYQIISGKRIIG